MPHRFLFIFAWPAGPQPADARKRPREEDAAAARGGAAPVYGGSGAPYTPLGPESLAAAGGAAASGSARGMLRGRAGGVRRGHALSCPGVRGAGRG